MKASQLQQHYQFWGLQFPLYKPNLQAFQPDPLGLQPNTWPLQPNSVPFAQQQGSQYMPNLYQGNPSQHKMLMAIMSPLNQAVLQMKVIREPLITQVTPHLPLYTLRYKGTLQVHVIHSKAPFKKQTDELFINSH